jgi:hypothetical protein
MDFRRPTSSNENNNNNNNKKENGAKKIVLEEITNVRSDPAIIKQNECAACHILFKLVDKMQVSESDASEMLSEVLSNDFELNDLFIQMVENIHMKQRMMAIPFSIKSREAKDRYIDSNLKNVLAELSSDLINYGCDIVLRKLLMSSIALGIAQNIGTDYHAATEELYYYMRKNESQTDQSIIEFIDGFYNRIKRPN